MRTQEEVYKEIFALKDELREMQKSAEPERLTKEYQFQTPSGVKTLADLFGERDALVILHNMGRSCKYCSLWADCLNPVADHIQTQASFVMVNGDDLEVQKQTKAERGWRFAMVRDDSAEFTADMGFYPDESYYPGISALIRLEDGTIARKNKSFLGPGDDYCALWPVLDLFGAGSDWEDKVVDLPVLVDHTL